jgi:hypothetical protein
MRFQRLAAAAAIDVADKYYAHILSFMIFSSCL